MTANSVDFVQKVILSSPISRRLSPHYGRHVGQRRRDSVLPAHRVSRLVHLGPFVLPFHRRDDFLLRCSLIEEFYRGQLD